MKKFNKKELAEVLGVYIKTISKWSNERIAEELAKNCYKVIDIKKEGRSVYFYYEYEEYTMSNDEHLKEVFKVRDINNFKGYSKRRIESVENKELITRKDLCEQTNTPDRTSKTYDDRLIKNGVLSKDGFIYVCVNKTTKEKVISTKEAYDNFWIKNGIIQTQLKDLGKKFKNNEITGDDYSYIKDVLLRGSTGDFIYYKLSKIAIQYDNYLYKMLMESK